MPKLNTAICCEVPELGLEKWGEATLTSKQAIQKLILRAQTMSIDWPLRLLFFFFSFPQKQSELSVLTLVQPKETNKKCVEAQEPWMQACKHAYKIDRQIYGRDSHWARHYFDFHSPDIGQTTEINGFDR